MLSIYNLSIKNSQQKTQYEMTQTVELLLRSAVGIEARNGLEGLSRDMNKTQNKREREPVNPLMVEEMNKMLDSAIEDLNLASTKSGSGMNAEVETLLKQLVAKKEEQK